MEQQQQYTCPMHPEIIKEEPGDCPLCGMHLVPLKKMDDKDAHAAKLVQMDHSKMKKDNVPAVLQQGKQ